ncbi:hypothetical protein A2Y99_01580 [Candidatus Gottesmanbacteria bacterium RBG_13_37_7]|uniref:Uncharacterized protein n=1 Tax=Candidatus Gottesmanbacteria bacterium RBG_13_37_7 TaxID=1798369 RepID=A0A1F5YIW1_9BACT|nr:MAG: hypothetical protein A2Y99_01580 [Candidatus Gottesmanbacteria bacterium RBG_13_37_7]
MIEAISGIGPGTGFGPGSVSTGGCVFESSLGQNAFGRIASKNVDKAISAIALDAATARSEIVGEPIGMYRLKVKEVQYRDKLSGMIVIEPTLVSPDFNDEPIAVWTDAGEYGTGSQDEYQRIVSRANQLAKTEGNASMFWVSPGNETDGIITPHRAYLWVKNGDEVTAYAYSLVGSSESLSRVVNNLGYQQDNKEEPLESRSVIRGREDKQITHREVFNAVISSLSEDELEQSQQFIQHFKKEVDTPDNVRELRIAQYQEQYEKELRETYKNDIKQALESIASGLIALPGVLGEKQYSGLNAVSTISSNNLGPDKLTQVEFITKEQPNQEIYSQSLIESKQYYLRPNITPLINGFIKSPNSPVSAFDPDGQISPVNPTVPVDLAGPNNPALQIDPIEHVDKDNQQLGFSNIEKQSVQQDIQPAIPIIIVLPMLLEKIINKPIYSISGDKQPETTDRLIAGKRVKVVKSGAIGDDWIVDNMTNIDDSSEDQDLSSLLDIVILQLLFTPIDDQVSLSVPAGWMSQKEDLSPAQEEYIDITAVSDNPQLFTEDGLGIEIDAQDIIERISNYLKNLDEVLDLDDPEYQIPAIPKEIAVEIINIGKKIIKLYSLDNRLFPFNGPTSEDRSDEFLSLNRLSVLISAYFDESLEQEIKQYIAIFIYYEIQTFRHTDQSNNSLMEELAQSIKRISDDAFPFKIRLDFLSEGLRQVLKIENEPSSILLPKSDDFSKYIFVILYLLSTIRHTGSTQSRISLINILKRIELIGRRHREIIKLEIPQAKYSIERLYLGNNTNTGLGLNKKKVKKKKSIQFPKTVVIYCFSQNIVYQAV